MNGNSIGINVDRSQIHAAIKDIAEVKTALSSITGLQLPGMETPSPRVPQATSNPLVDPKLLDVLLQIASNTKPQQLPLTAVAPAPRQ